MHWQLIVRHAHFTELRHKCAAGRHDGRLMAVQLCFAVVYATYGSFFAWFVYAAVPLSLAKSERQSGPISGM